MDPEHIRLLYDYNAWANHRTLDACATLSDQQFTRDLGSSYRSVRDTVVHIMQGEWFWHQRWQGRSPSSVPTPKPYLDLATVREHGKVIEADVLRFVNSRTAEDLVSVLHYRTTEGNPNSQPLWQMMQHVVNHGSYHRGQVTTMLRQLVAKPTSTDLIQFCRERGNVSAEAPLDSETIRLLFDYNAWANRRTLDACAALSDEQFTRDMGSSFPSVRDTLAHILWAEWLWLERWRGRSPGPMPSATEYPDPARWAEVERDLMGFVASLSTTDVARISEYRTTKGTAVANPLWQSLQHVVNHGTYHRGQVATLLRQLGAKPNYTDLIYFYRERAGQALD